MKKHRLRGVGHEAFSRIMAYEGSGSRHDYRVFRRELLGIPSADRTAAPIVENCQVVAAVQFGYFVHRRGPLLGIWR